MTSSHIPARLARLRQKLVELEAGAFLVSQPENRRYLSGFTGSAGHLLITSDRALIVVDFRYYEQAEMECPGYEIVRGKGTAKDIIGELLRSAPVSRIAFEADHATFASVEMWKEAAPEVEWLPTKQVVAPLRAIKDAEEVEAIRQAVAMTDEALAAALAEARPGMTELELAWRIESHMRTHGAEGVAFELIVAGGPNGARPHARPTSEPLAAGEPIVIDIGAKVDGYRSDLTRTVCLGQPKDPERFWEIYNLVLKAQVAAGSGIRPGMSGIEADALARNVIAEAGHGEHFGHGLGHGVGLEIHESPLLSFTSPVTIEAGMVITIEPGVYLPGWGGVRTEDLILLTENGAEVLTRAPKDPII